MIFQLLNNIDIFLLIFARVTGIFVSAPILSQRNIPVYIKLGFAFVITIVIFPIIQVSLNSNNIHIYFLIFLSIKELLIGIILGFICYLFLSSIYLAGHIIDMEMGFAIANVINPHDNTQIPLTANVLYIVFALIFLTINGHHTLIYALKYSFDCIPLGELNINLFMIDSLIQIMINVFIIAFKMAAPVLISIFIANVLLGILARTMPQMNVFMVGLPLKIIVGLIVLYLIFPLYPGFYEYLFEKMFEYLHQFIDIVVKE